MHTYQHLTRIERYTLFLKLQEGKSIFFIANLLKRSKSTIYRETRRNSHNGDYDPEFAENMIVKRQKERKNWDEKDPVLADYITNILLHNRGLVSPEIVANELRQSEYLPYESHVSIYNAIWRDGSVLNEVRAHLAQRGIRRKRRKFSGKKTSKIKGRRPISERPKAIETRDEYGHWEADTVHDGEKLYLTLVERKTRFAIVREVAYNAQNVKDTLLDIIKNERVPFEFYPRPFKFHSITFDNGSEFSYVPQLEKEITTLKTYFADPRHPEQRGSNENFNGLLRWFFPKKRKTPLRKLSLPEAVELLNKKKRKLHNFLSAYTMLLSYA